MKWTMTDFVDIGQPWYQFGVFSNMCIPTQTFWKKIQLQLVMRTNIQKFRPLQLNVLTKI